MKFSVPTRDEINQAILDNNLDKMRYALIYLMEEKSNEWRSGLMTGIGLTSLGFVIFHYLGYF